MLYALYRHPDDTLDYLQNLQLHMEKYVNSKIILAGDFNLPEVDWQHLRAGAHNSQHVNVIFDIMLTDDIEQLMHKPTRVQGDSRSVLDLVFFPRGFVEHAVSVEKDLSDHRHVSVSTPFVPSQINKKSEIRTLKNYASANDACIIDYLETRLQEFSDSDSDVCLLWGRASRQFVISA